MGERLTTIEATCRLCWHLMHGEGITTVQAAKLTGYTRQGAWQMLCAMSRYLPLRQDDDGVWALIVMDGGREYPAW